MITSKIKTKPTISVKVIIFRPLSSKYGVTYENKTIHTPPPPLHSKLGCLLISTGRLKSCTTLQEEGGRRRGYGKLYFSLFNLAKSQRCPLGQSVSTNFVANGSKKKIYIYIYTFWIIFLGHPQVHVNFQESKMLDTLLTGSWEKHFTFCSERHSCFLIWGSKLFFIIDVHCTWHVACTGSKMFHSWKIIVDFQPVVYSLREENGLLKQRFCFGCHELNKKVIQMHVFNI